jgi:REP element-mobilizing transposase RayT
LSTGAGPAVLLARNGMPHPWQFTGGPRRTRPVCSFVTDKSANFCYIVFTPTNLHRYYGAGYSHFITTSCYQRRPLLGTPRSRDLFLEVMEQIRRRHRFVVVGYVVMPEHVHLLFTEPERGNPSLVMAALKQTFRPSAAARGCQERCPDRLALEYTCRRGTRLAAALLRFRCVYRR